MATAPQIMAKLKSEKGVKAAVANALISASLAYGELAASQLPHSRCTCTERSVQSSHTGIHKHTMQTLQTHNTNPPRSRRQPRDAGRGAHICARAAAARRRGVGGPARGAAAAAAPAGRRTGVHKGEGACCEVWPCV